MPKIVGHRHLSLKVQNVEYSIYNTSNDITPKSSMYCRSNQIQHRKLYIESQKAVSFGISRAFNTHRTSKSSMYCKRTPFEHWIFDIEFDLTVPLGNDTLKTSFQLNNKHSILHNSLPLRLFNAMFIELLFSTTLQHYYNVCLRQLFLSSTKQPTLFDIKYSMYC